MGGAAAHHDLGAREQGPATAAAAADAAAAACAPATAQPTKPMLQYVSLSGNRITRTGARALLDALLAGPVVSQVQLDLRDNPVPPREQLLTGPAAVLQSALIL